jgi:hypothetical protein
MPENVNKKEPLPVTMHSFEDVETMISFFYANKSLYQVMKGEKSYSNPNLVELPKH